MSLKTKEKKPEPVVLGTRAVVRPVIAGSRDVCAYKKCPADRKEILWRARRRMMVIIANIYGRDGDPTKWDRVEHFHEECYDKARRPYGKAAE